MYVHTHDFGRPSKQDGSLCIHMCTSWIKCSLASGQVQIQYAPTIVLNRDVTEIGNAGSNAYTNSAFFLFCFVRPFILRVHRKWNKDPPRHVSLENDTNSAFIELPVYCRRCIHYTLPFLSAFSFHQNYQYSPWSISPVLFRKWYPCSLVLNSPYLPRFPNIFCDCFFSTCCFVLYPILNQVDLALSRRFLDPSS